ncbi:2-dehydro-3-deoxy-6-phosphogalactonate aldolase [Cohaesibacter celericrescens]|uniref:2-dehydro-3-deoxy-6-phosphogalactonate aldolase n=1 Tax=Cohaesibacter celericrescens TaxID=2067669 RepID=A0A2N5XLD7_9HYPH|nr:2-dehydro-3-deoxy-6-phosphogalactonate aldolase [Cohaesibacter celericrescens]PLW75313.1 2-dehydro-3-deoxy-6-phosphogalactonate aldolase [Cohaesibacter celericrescens]
MVSDNAVAFDKAFAQMPLIAILRGITPDESEAILKILVEAGFTLIEVPLNSPDAFKSIELMAKSAPEGVLIGAGTVLRAQDVKRLKEVGGRFVVTPNTDLSVIEASVSSDMPIANGCMTPTEALAAAKAGATILKIFPAARLGAGYIKDIKAVLPPQLPVVAVGGVGPNEFEEFVAHGVVGFGIGSDLWKPGRTPQDVAASAKALVAKWEAIR